MPKEFLQHVFNTDWDESGLTLKDVNNHKYLLMYKLSCFTYMLAGFIRFYDNEKLDGINLIIQSFISYISDVNMMGKRSKWHIIDRYYAITISFYHFYSIRNSILLTKFMNVLLFFIGFKYLKKSQNLYKIHDTNFLLEHSKWHLVAPLMAIFK